MTGTMSPMINTTVNDLSVWFRVLDIQCRDLSELTNAVVSVRILNQRVTLSTQDDTATNNSYSRYQVPQELSDYAEVGLAECPKLISALESRVALRLYDSERRVAVGRWTGKAKEFLAPSQADATALSVVQLPLSGMTDEYVDRNIGIISIASRITYFGDDSSVLDGESGEEGESEEGERDGEGRSCERDPSPTLVAPTASSRARHERGQEYKRQRQASQATDRRGFSIASSRDDRPSSSSSSSSSSPSPTPSELAETRKRVQEHTKEAVLLHVARTRRGKELKDASRMRQWMKSPAEVARKSAWEDALAEVVVKEEKGGKRTEEEEREEKDKGPLDPDVSRQAHVFVSLPAALSSLVQARLLPLPLASTLRALLRETSSGATLRAVGGGAFASASAAAAAEYAARQHFVEGARKKSKKSGRPSSLSSSASLMRDDRYIDGVCSTAVATAAASEASRLQSPTIAAALARLAATSFSRSRQEADVLRAAWAVFELSDQRDVTDLTDSFRRVAVSRQHRERATWEEIGVLLHQAGRRGKGGSAERKREQDMRRIRPQGGGGEVIKDRRNKEEITASQAERGRRRWEWTKRLAMRAAREQTSATRRDEGDQRSDNSECTTLDSSHGNSTMDFDESDGEIEIIAAGERKSRRGEHSCHTSPRQRITRPRSPVKNALQQYVRAVRKSAGDPHNRTRSVYRNRLTHNLPLLFKVQQPLRHSALPPVPNHPWLGEGWEDILRRGGEDMSPREATKWSARIIGRCPKPTYSSISYLISASFFSFLHCRESFSFSTISHFI